MFEKTYGGMPDAPLGFTFRLSARFPRRRFKVLAWFTRYMSYPSPLVAARIANAVIDRSHWDWRIDDGKWRSEPIPFSVELVEGE